MLYEISQKVLLLHSVDCRSWADTGFSTYIEDSHICDSINELPATSFAHRICCRSGHPFGEHAACSGDQQSFRVLIEVV